jgi:NTP pyrophosphatase (non-canonical NTP hydrolase)
MNATLNGWPIDAENRLTLEGRRSDMQRLIDCLQRVLQMHPSEGPFMVQVLQGFQPRTDAPPSVTVQEPEEEEAQDCCAEEAPSCPTFQQMKDNSRQAIRDAVRAPQTPPEGIPEAMEHLSGGFGAYLLRRVMMAATEKERRQRKEEAFLNALSLATAEASAEVLDARERFGEFASPHEAFAVLLEEVDELRAAVFSEERSMSRVCKELRSVAAMALSFSAVAQTKAAEQFGR